MAGSQRPSGIHSSGQFKSRSKILIANDRSVDRFKSGDWVVINDGPFTNYKAMFDCRLSGQDRARVLLELLQGQKMRLELSAHQLQPLTH